MNLEKLKPWNWFKHEDNTADNTAQIPMQRDEASRTGLSTWQQRDQHPIVQLHEQIDRLFDDVFSGFGMPSLRLSPTQHGGPGARDINAYRPQIDVSGDDRQYEITLDVPGLSENDLSIEIKDDMLIVRGQKEETNERPGKQFYSIERSYGAFQRTLSLPTDANADDIQATLKDGVLTLVISRSQTEQADFKRIEISSK
ncbi:MAG: Hsp20/alpha crystallin family protein [Pseudomonadales bacterium]|nr:Hsp20/alpha crystallin family protein [Pseudomonadales bacterium]